MSTMSEHRRRRSGAVERDSAPQSVMRELRRQRMGLDADSEELAEEQAVEVQEKPQEDKKKEFVLPYWLDKKTLIWMIIVAAGVIALCVIK